MEAAENTQDLVLGIKYLLIIITCSGLFGGAVSAIFDFMNAIKPLDDSNTHTDCSICALFSGKSSNIIHKIEILLFRSIIGVAGAFGVVLFGLWSGKLTINNTVNDQLILISLCVIAGTISFKMLPKLGNKLEEQLLAKQVSKNEKTATAAIQMSVNAIDHTSTLAFAGTALQKGETYTPEIPQAIEKLKKLKKQFSHDRTLHMYLGRLYRKNSQLDEAIIILREFIKNINEPNWLIENNNAENDLNLADAYYNIACYHSLKLKQETADNEKERYKEEIITALRRAFELNPSNIEYSRTDNDLKVIRDTQEYIDLT